MPRAVLFDIDGTLVTFKFDVEGTRRALIGELAKRGFDASRLTLASPTQEIINEARKQLDRAGRVAEFDGLRRRLHAILDRFEVESSREAVVFPGTRKVLIGLRDNSIRLGVLTNAGKKAAFSVLRRGKLLDCFEFVLTREDVASMKPSPEGIVLAVRRFGLPRRDVFYVGDGVFDIIAAKSARVKVVSVATGLYDVQRLRQEGSDAVIGSLSELPRAIGL